jgi:D-alanyl-D-alanine dipeptidase
MKKYTVAITIFLLGITAGFSLPKDFVYLSQIAPTIQQDIRYYGNDNLLGRPIKGYNHPVCILTRPTAIALQKVQRELNQQGLGLKVFDCYRPQMAVTDFVVWSQNRFDQKTKRDFYPNVNKKELFALGYIAAKSGHTRGSTVDLTVIYLKNSRELNMGTHFDFMDPLSHSLYHNIPYLQFQNRMLLRTIMLANGFTPLPEEWWHFTFTNELYPRTYFNFPVA